MSRVQKCLFIFAFISLLQVTLSLVKIEENKNDFGNEVKPKIESKTGHLDIKNIREKRNEKLEIINDGFEQENTEIESNDGIYPLKIAGYAVSLSAIAYCSDNVILSGNYSDNQLSSVPTIDVYPIDVEDFYPTNLIHDPELDVNGYMGYSLQQNLIFIVFRGSTSKENWKTDFDSVRTTYPTCPGCEVHEGFYLSFLSVKKEVLKFTQDLQNRFPTFSVIVTGHSLGGAIATLAAVDLAVNDIKNVFHYSFGSPRVGNAEAAMYMSNVLPMVRTTHYRDIVPHHPTMVMGFTHVTTEWYEDDTGKIKSCKGSEDRHCSDQWTFLENINDHYHYLGRRMSCSIIPKTRSPTLSTTSSPSLVSHDDDDIVDRNDDRNKNESNNMTYSSDDDDNTNSTHTDDTTYNVTSSPTPTLSPSLSSSSPSHLPSLEPSNSVDLNLDTEYLPQIKTPAAPQNISNVFMGSTKSSYSSTTFQTLGTHHILFAIIITVITFAVFAVIINGVYRRFLHRTSCKRGQYTIVQ